MLLFYIRTLSPTVPLEDGGEMIRAAATLGVTHPPGYPLYALVGRMISVLPVGDPAFRLNFMSALFGSWACGICACIVAKNLRDSTSRRRESPATAWFCGAFAGLLLGAGVGVWWQSVIAEKYTANLLLNAVLAAVIMSAMMSRKPRPRHLLLIAFVFGMSASHHGQTIYFAPAALFAVARLASRKMVSRGVSRAVLLAIFGLVLGMSLKFVYPPVRSEQGPLHSWNDPNTLPNFVKYFSGNVYQHRVGAFDPLMIARKVGTYFYVHVPNQFGLAGSGEKGKSISAAVLGLAPVALLGTLGLLGLLWQMKSRPAEFTVWALTLATGLAFCANFDLAGIAIQTYYMPTFLVLCVWTGLGAARAASLLARVVPRLSLPAAGILLVALARVFQASGGEADRSRHYFAYDFAKALLATPEPKSVLIPLLDYDMFPLWYVHDVLKKRADVMLADSNYNSPGWRDALAKRIRKFYPAGYSGFTDRLKSGENPLARDLGTPVYFTLVYRTIEEADFLPRGAVYRYVWREEELLKADVVSEWRRFKRWRTVRGCFDRTIPKDRHTRFVVGYWAYSAYRRAHVLSRQGLYRDAEEILRSVLAWPYFTGDPASVRIMLGWCLERRGRRTEALREYEAAVLIAPTWGRALRLLGTLYYDLGRPDDSLRIFRKAMEAEPSDLQVRRNVAALEKMLSERGARKP